MIDSRNDPWYAKIAKLFLEVLIFGAIVFVGMGIVMGIFSVTGLVDMTAEPDMTRPFFDLVTNYIPIILIFSGAMYVCNNLVFKRDWSVTGLVKEGWLKDTSDGYLLAFLLIGLGFVTLRLLGNLDLEDVNFEPYYFFGFLLMFFVQSASEEVMARSWLMPAIESRFGPWAALLLSSGVFAAIHIGNPNVNGPGILNIFLAGMMLGMFFLKYRNIWFITGLHAGWNWMQASVFDFNVSGFDVPSMINFNPHGNELISGGEFGYEGSVVSCIALSLVIGYLLFKNYDDMFGNRPIYYEPIIDETILDNEVLD